MRGMHRSLARLRANLRMGRATDDQPGFTDPADACSWQAMRHVYEEQAARGVPDAVRGLALIEQGRWPSSGRPRDG